MQTQVHLSVSPGTCRQPGGLWAPTSPVRGVEDGFHFRDVGLERDGAEFIQLLVVEQ